MLKINTYHKTLVHSKTVHLLFQRYFSAQSDAIRLPLNYLNGKRVDPEDPTNETLHVEEPSTGKILCSVSGSGRGDINAAIKCAQSSMEEWSQRSGFERSKVLLEAARILGTRQDEVAQLEVTDTGKPIWEARGDVQTVIDSLNYFGGLAPSFCGQYFALPSGSFAYTRREPLGVIAAIGAWNYPIQMAGWKSAPALACGNAVVFKPSQFTPLTAVVLGEVFQDAGLPDGVFNVVQGGAETGSYLTSHPNIAKVTFTGSVETGTKIMATCAEGIKQVTLELGGKSPLILFDDCDIKNAVNGALNANFFSQGQVCSNGTRVFIHKSIFDDVVSQLVERTKSIRHGDPLSEDTQMGAMINAAHAKKVMGFIERAKCAGAEILCGGAYVTLDDPKLKGKYISPCIIKATDDMEISQEEVFGPVMNVYSFESEEEVLERANDTRFGLASGVFTKDLNRAHRFAAKIQAGVCYINNYNITPSEVPFGGYKMSGLGRENGSITVEYFSQLKTVYVESNDIESPY